MATVVDLPAAESFGVSTRSASKARAVGFVALLGLLLAAAGAAGLALAEYRHLNDQAEAETRRTALLLADHASRLLQAADIALLWAAERIAGMDWPEIARSQALREDLAALSEGTPQIDEIVLSSNDGTVQLSSVEDPALTAEVVAGPSSIPPHEPARAPVAAAQPLAIAPGFTLSRQLSGPEGTFGMASAALSSEDFANFWSRLQPPFDARVTLFSAADLGVLAQHAPDEGGAFAPGEVDGLGALIAAGADSGTLRIEASAGDRPAVGTLSFQKVGDFPIYLAVSVRREAVGAAWRARVLPYVPFVAAAFLALAGLSLFAFRQARREARERADMASVLEAQLSGVHAAKAQLETLLDELNHRVKNNLQVVTSLLRLESQRVEDPRLRRSLDESVQRIQAMALLHQQLSHARAQSGLSVAPYLRELCVAMAEAYGVADRITVEVEADDVCLDLQSATPLALIVNEIISNALKYAYPEKRHGRIALRLARVEGSCELIVEDDGVGLPAQLDSRAGGGLGMRIVRSLVGQLDGTADYGGAAGTRFCLRFPLAHAPGAAPDGA